MNAMAFQFVLGIVRHVLTFGGGMLTAQGWGEASDWDQIIGAILTLVGVAWSVWNKRRLLAGKPAEAPAPLATRK